MPTLDAVDDVAVLGGLCGNATVEDVQHAYRRQALDHHTDRGGDKPAFQRLKASADRLLAGIADADPSMSQYGVEVISEASSCRDNIRCLVVLDALLGAPALLTIDEQQAVVTPQRRRQVVLQAADEIFL